MDGPATKFSKIAADQVAADVILPITLGGAVANAQYVEFEAPWDFQIEEVSARAAQAVNPADGVVTVDVRDDGASILAAPLEYAAADTTYRETMKKVIAKGSIVRIVFALTGTGPQLANTVVALTGRRAVV